jgi:hypothetical protein
MRQIILILLFVPLLLQAEASPFTVCTQQEAISAEEEASSLSDWGSIYRSFKKFSRCDDGAIGEGYSNSVSKLLAHDWDSLPELLSLIVSNKEFEEFVISHIDETVPVDELNLIINNSISRCPKDASAFCDRIKAAAR